MDRRCQLLAEHHHRPGEEQRLVALVAQVFFGIVLLAAVLVFIIEPAHALQVDIGGESITMKGKSEKLATFPHRRHQEWHGCTACHHVKDQIMTIDKCEACHNDNMKSTKVEGLKNAVHVMCKRCHIKERAKGRQAAPTQCRGGCHI